MEVPPVQLQQSASPELAGAPESGGTSEPGVTSELRETPEPKGLDKYDSGPPTPLRVLGRGIPHERPAKIQAGSVGHGGEGERGSVGGKNMPAPDTTTAPSDVYLSSESNEKSADGDISVEGSETSSSDESRPVP